MFIFFIFVSYLLGYKKRSKLYLCNNYTNNSKPQCKSLIITNKTKNINLSYLGFLFKQRDIKSLASSETPSNSSAGKSSDAVDMFLKVSWSLSPPKGENPVRRTYATTPSDHISAARVIGSMASISGAKSIKLKKINNKLSKIYKIVK